VLRRALLPLAFTLVAGSVGAVLESAGGAEDRRARAFAAGEEFRRTHLFEDGRGVHALPDLLAVARRSPGGLRHGSVARALEAGGVGRDERGLIGFHEASWRGVRVPVAGCAACHVGRAAGRTYPGLGNKAIDVGEIGRRQLDLVGPFALRRAWTPANDRFLVDEALTTARRFADPDVGNLTRGMVSVGLIFGWFQRQQPVEPYAPQRAAVKVPHLWGYAEKRSTGLYCDGMGKGAGWLALVEMTAGQHPETVRAYVRRIEHVETLLERLLPPPYPFAVDRAAATRGGLTFAERCAGCHGTYERDEEGLPRFRAPHHVPWEQVGTDDDRLLAVTPAVRRAIRESPLGDLVRLTEHLGGYFAPRLEGVWARFPYFHNGSAPTLRAVLTRPSERPEVWSLDEPGEAHRYDAVAGGYTVPARGSLEELELLLRARHGARDVYWTRREGHSNRGHAMAEGLTSAERADLIEYLKTL
jgi:mono/diheme cytochrome c family protein